MRNAYGQTVVVWNPGWCRRRVCRWCPRRRWYWFQVKARTRWYVYLWRPWKGIVLTSSGVAGTPVTEPDHVFPLENETVKRRPLAQGTTPAQRPALPSTSVMLAKLPVLREFCSATTYEDGSAREPGYFTFRNRGFTYELTVYDPDSGTRLAVRAPEIDKVFQSMEQLLGVEEAPWERDRYLAEQLEGKTKKKRK